MQTISTKELREELPRIRSELAKGTQYTLIYRSKPIARLEPLQSDSMKKVRIQGGPFRIQENMKQRLTPEFLNKIAEQKYE